jgi:tripartite-type tricarboxylate transporter receptor subunit TctC
VWTLRKRSNAGIFVILAVLVGASTFAARSGYAQEWPTRPVKIVVPNGAGGVSDILARMTADRLSKAFNQPFIIENRGGAGGSIGTEYAARSPNDGYTLYFGGGAQFLVNPLLRKLPYDPLKDLTPISMVSLNGMALVVNPELPVHSLPEFLAYAKANPGQINYGFAGLGQSSHLASAALAGRAGLNLVAVPYQSTPPALIGLVSGTVHMFFGNISDVLDLVQSNKARLLAISTENRMPQFPDVPTVSETIPGFVMTGWIGYFAPAGTPKTIIDRVSRELISICREPDVVKIMTNVGIESIGTTPDEFGKIIDRDVPIARSAVEAAGLVGKDLNK